MPQNVIEFAKFRKHAGGQALLPALQISVLELFWYDSRQQQRVMRTGDRAMIRRQMESLRRRGVMAEVFDHHGARCGSVRAITTLDGTLAFSACLEGEQWGND